MNKVFVFLYLYGIITKFTMNLPQNINLPISSLARIFDNTTATYKFYWFVAMMDIVVKEHKKRISFWEIIAGMIAAPYPINANFLLSF